MTVFVDTSVWSLAFRRDVLPDLPEIDKLRLSLDAGSVYCSGMVLQELLQGFARPKAHKQIIRRFSSIPLLVPDRDDYIQAAEWRNKCRRNGVQAGTIDALLAQLCIRYELTMLTLDHDFHHMADIIPLSLWQAGTDESRKETATAKQRDVVQVKNPRTDRYIKIDRSAGQIIAHKKSAGPYKNIPVARKKK